MLNIVFIINYEFLYSPDVVIFCENLIQPILMAHPRATLTCNVKLLYKYFLMLVHVQSSSVDAQNNLGRKRLLLLQLLSKKKKLKKIIVNEFRKKKIVD